MVQEYVATLIFDESKTLCLLVESRKSSISYWSPPGGKIENGESSLFAAIREVKQETHLTVALNEESFIDTYLGSLEYQKGTFKVHFYGVNNFKGNPKAASDALSFQWFPVKEILNSGDEYSFISSQIKYFLRDNVKRAIRSYLNNGKNIN